jgi:O-antigen/teichoic acid export membrane protein
MGRPSAEIARRALAYGAPLLPTLLSFWVLDRSNRFFIGHLLGQSAVGIFSASYALGSLVIHAQMPFQMTLFPKVASLWDTDRGTAKRYIELSTRFYLTLAIPFTAACAVVAPPLLSRLGNEEIAAESAVLTVLVAAGFTLYGVSVMQVQVLHGARRTGVQGAISVLAALINVALNAALIPLLGVVGSAVATMVSYLAVCVMLASVAKRYLSISYNPVYLAKCVLAAALMLAPMAALAPRGVAGLAAAIGIGAATYFAALFALRAFDQEEIAFAKRAAVRLRAALTSRSASRSA